MHFSCFFHFHCQNLTSHGCRDDLKNRLNYLKYCIKESLRLYPPSPTVGRQLIQNTEIDGRVFPAGTWVFVVTYAVHHCDDIWENPEVGGASL